MQSQPITSKNPPENTNTSLEASPIENMDTIIHSQPTGTFINETIDSDFNSTLLDDGTPFSSHTVNTLIELDDNGQNNSYSNKNNNATNDTTNNTNIYRNHQHRQPVKSTGLTQNSGPLNKTLPTLPNINTPLPRLQRQNSIHFNFEPLILNNSTQPTLTTNQTIQITPQQSVNLVRQLDSQNNQQSTNAPTPYYLQAASTQTPSPVVCRTTQIIYPYFGGSVPMQQPLRPFHGTDSAYTTEGFLNAITANMVMTAGPEQTDSPYHDACILKQSALIQRALIGPAQQRYSLISLEIKKNWQAFCREFQKTFDKQQSQIIREHNTRLG